jgi:hypothetical protein
MKTFREFAQDKDFEAVKSIVLDILDPDGDSIANEKSILTRPLSDFKHKHQLLTAPSLADIINRQRSSLCVHTRLDKNKGRQNERDQCPTSGTAAGEPPRKS